MSAKERCAPAAELRGDQLHGTAAPARFFVLVEQPGAWGRNAVGDWQRDHPVRNDLLRRTHEAGARLLLVRRLHREPGEPRRWALVDVRPGSEATHWGAFDDDRELGGLDPREPAGEPSSEPVLLVCTHGRRDACCAQRGWPVAAALTEAYPDRVWQCSHVGGDRFAANLVVLPQGLYYGRLTAASALEVVRGHLDGRVAVRSLRGRSCFVPAVQAAQHYAREALGLDAIDALRPLELDRQGDAVVAVRLAVDGGEARVVVREGISPPLERLTCGATEATSIRTWTLLELDVV
ncbi:MAG TPA: sucrase ferredoxin [Gaiella sp.]|nr:sucrase ferredoxin [Gaiella sp.]